ncbi:MAG: PTS fructose transporter subunit IIA [Aerococcus sp.]|nr:PTS fructose transporter subunit IIA [Aerococcus sp.]
MLGIIIATHGALSDGLKNAGEVIMGETQRIETINLVPGQAVDSVKDDITAAMNKLGIEQDILILTDIAGASPYNQSLLAIHELPEELASHVCILHGVNLPMLLSAMNQQILGADLKAAAQTIVQEAKESIGLFVEAVDEDDEDDDDF